MRRRHLVGSAMLAGLLLGGCGAAATPASHLRRSGVVTFALPPGQTPSYIFPFMSGAYSNNVNIFQLDALLYPPLYWFGTHGEPTINYGLSLGRPPVFSNHGRTVTIALRHRSWSDGRPVTNRDIEFWMRMLVANPSDWLGYVPGSIPDNLTGMSFPASRPYQFSLTFNRAYSHLWLLYNQLSQIIPMPQHAWDKTSARGPIGNYDRTRSGASSVYRFLNGQARDEGTYPTNPLWKVVDGAWQVAAFDPATGYTAFTPQPHASGLGTPHVARIEEIPFTSDTAEFDALRAGELDYGYLPAQDLPLKASFVARGYRVVPWVDWGFNSLFLNYTNPKVGVIFRQLYVRQAMQHLIDQAAIARDIYHGAAFPTYGPVPVLPTNPYVSSAERHNPYPYSVSAARSLLSRHGWTVSSGGTDTCQRPGAGASECGAGISRGTALAFTMRASNGSEPFDAETQTMQSDWSLAGIHVSLTTGPPSEIISTSSPCVPKTGAGCQWEISDIGAPGSTPTYSPGYLPTGGVWFATGGNNNISGYHSATMNALVAATHTSSSLGVFDAYENYAATHLPELWQPSYYYQVSVIRDRLHGAVPQDPNLNLYPQDWTLGG
ncbi:MAG TPA: ABC transporter substrate-binding protein [Verrucomicrobiae bacterium]|nr:ABC transporter substrate-binding protein [Verrucomicrobiae bacterium]